MAQYRTYAPRLHISRAEATCHVLCAENELRAGLQVVVVTHREPSACHAQQSTTSDCGGLAMLGVGSGILGGFQDTRIQAKP